jgi:hypothetical protein
MYCVPDDGVWKIETCRRCNVLIIELHFGIVNLVDFSTIVLHVQTATSRKWRWRAIEVVRIVHHFHRTCRTPKHHLVNKVFFSLERVVLVKGLTETPDELKPTLQTVSYMLRSLRLWLQFWYTWVVDTPPAVCSISLATKSLRKRLNERSLTDAHVVTRNHLSISH